MKNLSYLIAVVIAGTLALSTVAQARGYGANYDRSTPQHRFENHIDRRQARQWDRIKQGIDNGDLSRKEARRLARNQRQIARMEDRFERDGYYSPREKQKLERALNRTGKRIKRAKHSDHGRPYGGHHHGWRGKHHRHEAEPYAYSEPDESYVTASASSTSISAQTDGFSVSWSTSHQE